ncbi:MAG: copper-binding protein [Burkholderiales bacterium]|nr:copper-binding protein [Burkholderiales bacterium]
MTKMFRVKDPAMLDILNPGDKVMFKAEKANGILIVAHVQPAK